MSDYYELPPPKKARGHRWLYLLLLLLFLFGIAATLWSLRLRPGEIGMDPTITAASAPGLAPLPASPPVPSQPESGPQNESPLAWAEETAPEEYEPEAGKEPEADNPAGAERAPIFSEVRWRETARFTGSDPEGRGAEFTAYVLVGDETWTFARADSVFAAGLSAPVETAFEKLDLGAGICDLTRIIAVGAASVEGTSQQNTFLSHARGHALRAAITANLPCDEEVLPVSVLDLGYSRRAVTCAAGEALCPGLSAPQRPIAMILVETEDPATDISGALQAGMAAHEAAGGDVLPGVLVSDYSAFDLR